MHFKSLHDLMQFVRHKEPPIEHPLVTEVPEEEAVDETEEVAEEVTEEEPEIEEPEEEVNYEEMKRDDLLAIASEKGLTLPKKATKAAIIEAIVGA